MMYYRLLHTKIRLDDLCSIYDEKNFFVDNAIISASLLAVKQIRLKNKGKRSGGFCGRPMEDRCFGFCVELWWGGFADMIHTF